MTIFLSVVCYSFPFQPIGIKAAAMLLTPLSVASRLNWAAAFLVSCISTFIPRELIYFLVSGVMGYVEAPKPRIRRSRWLSVFKMCNRFVESSCCIKLDVLLNLYEISFTYQALATQDPARPTFHFRQSTALWD